MRTCSRNSQRAFVGDDYFERKARELVVPEDEIEAWELEAQDLDSLGTHADFGGAAGLE